MTNNMADSAVESLERNPDTTITWGAGLADLWDAADGGMETSIGLLQQLYYLEQMVDGADLNEIQAKLNESVAFQKEATTQVKAHE